MFFDPLYWIVIAIGGAISLWAASRTKGQFARFSKFTTRCGMTGAQVARRILADNGISDVDVERVAGTLSDHYDPRNRVLRLSEGVHDSRSMAAFGVAAHEVGHAIQHAQGYKFLEFRSAWVPFASKGGSISIIVLIIAAVLGGVTTPAGSVMALVGLLAFSCTTLFTLITLPVEFDASRRALIALEQGGYTTPEELQGAKKVLDAAAMTYVAAFVTSLMALLYWAYRLGLFGGRRG